MQCCRDVRHAYDIRTKVYAVYYRYIRIIMLFYPRAMVFDFYFYTIGLLHVSSQFRRPRKKISDSTVTGEIFFIYFFYENVKWRVTRVVCMLHKQFHLLPPAAVHRQYYTGDGLRDISEHNIPSNSVVLCINGLRERTERKISHL